MSAAKPAGPTGTLTITDLHASVEGREILRGVSLTVRSGEVHVLMGPNGSGKSTLSHVLMGNPDYVVSRGSATLDGEELLGLPTHQRAARGLFLAMQYPIEVPGVSLEDLLRNGLTERGATTDGLRVRIETEADRIHFDRAFLDRPVNVDLSGGEKKRNETVQLAILKPKIAVLDEIDSGLDIDALRDVARRIEAATTEDGLGVLAITHYTRLLSELKPDTVHILLDGRIVASGGPELAENLEHTGYESFADAVQ